MPQLDAITAARLDHLTEGYCWAMFWSQTHGFPVLPCRPDTKGPLIEGGKDRASTDPDRIAQWWKEWPYALVGGRTDGLIVLDYDSYKPGHGADVAALGTLPLTRQHTSPGHDGIRGVHLFYRDACGQCRSRKFGPNRTIDIRSGGSRDYVILPGVPSAAGRYEIAEWRPVAQAPAALESLCQASRVTAGTALEDGLPEPEPLPDGVSTIAILNTGTDDPSTHTFRLIKSARSSGLTAGQALTLAEADPITTERRSATRRQQNGWWPAEFWRCWNRASNVAPREVRKEEMLSGNTECTDAGNADRFVHDHGENIRYAFGVGWLAWNGKLWQPDDEYGRTVQFAVRTARSIFREAEAASDSGRAKDLAKWALASQARQRIDAMRYLASTDPEVRILASDLDTDPYLLTANNGTLDLRTGELLPFSRDHLITRGSPVDYDPSATCPRWASWLKWFTEGDDELAEWVQLAAGFTLIGSSGAQYWIFMHGTGGNGKTTLVETLAGLLGPRLAITADPEMLSVARRQGGHSDALAQLAGARMVYLAEANSRGRWDESLIKQLTGGDKVSASFKGGRTFEFLPQMTLWAYGNSIPEFRDDSEGFWRRIRLWELSQKVPPADKIEKLWDVLIREEGPGILAWAVQGAVKAANWLTDGRGELPTPPSVAAATQAYRDETDVVGQFAREHLQLSAGSRVDKASLWANYGLYLRRGGDEFAKNAVDLKSQLLTWFLARDHEVTSVTVKGKQCLRGVKLRGT